MKKNFGFLAFPFLAFLCILSCKNSNDALLGKIYNKSIGEFKKEILKKDATLVDVRTPEEYNEGHLEGAINVNWEAKTFRNYILNAPQDKPILIYCRSGKRSGKAASALKTLGFEEIYNLKNGFMGWTADNQSFSTTDNKGNISFQQKAKSTKNDVAAAMEAAIKKSLEKIRDVNSTEFQKAMSMENVILLDVRTPKEYEEGHIQDAENIDWNSLNFKQKISQLDKEKLVLIYCRSGIRSAKATSTMKAMGFKNIYHYKKGMLGWEADNLPIEK